MLVLAFIQSLVVLPPALTEKPKIDEEKGHERKTRIVFTQKWPVFELAENKVVIERVQEPDPPRQVPVPKRQTGGITILARDCRQCVVWARAARRNVGREGPYGNAWQLRPDSAEPSLYSVVLFPRHAAVVVGFDEETITLVEANFIPCVITERRIRRDDSQIRGYII